MTAPATDPVDTFDITTDDPADEIPMPTSMIMGGEVQTDPPAVEETPPEPAEGRERGPDGKFAKKADEPEAPATTEAPSDLQAPKPEPFRYRTNGETKDADGFLQHADGSVVVSAEKVSELRYLLNAKDMLGQESEFVNQVKARNTELEQQIEQYKKGESADIAKANALVDTYSRMLQEPDDAKAVEAFFSLRAQYPVLLARAEAQHYRTLAERGKPQQQPKDAVPSPVATAPSLPSREDATKATQDHIEHVKLDHTLKDLSADDWKQFEARTQRTPYAYIRPASADEAKRLGLNEGSLVFDDIALKADVEAHATSLRKARETTQSTAKLAADNARRTQPGITAPPSPGGSTAPAKAPKRIQSEKDWEDYMNSDEI